MIAYFYRYPVESVSVFVTLFPILAMLYRMDYRHSVLKYAFWLFVSKFIVEVSMLFMAVERQNNLFLYNASLLISFSFLAKLFYVAFDMEVDRILVKCASIVFAIVWVLDLMHVGTEHSMQFSGTTECVFVIFFVVRYFWELALSLKVMNLFTFPLFWLCIWICFYYCSLTFVAPVYHILDQWGAPTGFEFLIALPSIVDVFFLTVLGIGFLKSD